MSSSNVCHCCLEPECSKDVFCEYDCDGKKEIYFDMLFRTFNITVSHETSTKICDQCITELRRATKFKKKVLNSAKYLATVNCMKVEKSLDVDDFGDKIGVDFEENLHATYNDKNTGETFVIQLNHRNGLEDCNNHNKIDAELENEIKINAVTSDCFDGAPTFAKKKQERSHPKSVKQKLNQPESQIHKDLKQNSLKLVFNSNLCLFKSLKTKFGCFLCREAFLSIKELRTHSKTHCTTDLIRIKFNRLRGVTYQNADISSLECTKCKQACIDLNDLKKHLTEVHSIKFGDAEHFLIPYKLEHSFNCVLCNEKFNTYMRLSVHMNNQGLYRLA